LELVRCPDCGTECPKMKRCLSCGHTFQVEEESEMRQVEGEGVEALPETVQGGGMNSIENDEFSVFEPAATPVAKREEGCDRVTRDVMEDLVKGLSMQLWSVDMLQEGKVNETQFTRLFADFSTRRARVPGRPVQRR
jgi:hypothetical protein